MKIIAKTGLKVKATIKAGGFSGNHNRLGLKVRAAIKAGGFSGNHNRSGLKIRAGVKAGMQFCQNHSRRVLAIA